MDRKNLTIILLTAAVLLLGGWTGLGQKQKPADSNIVWEYTVTGLGTSYLGDKELNQLGAQGWELVAISNSDRGYNFYLKRIKR